MESEKKIEQLLRAYAERRRSKGQGSLAMSSAMLERLRRELDVVNRPRPESALPRVAWLESLWFRLTAGAVGMAALLALWFFWPEPNRIQISQAQKNSADYLDQNVPEIQSIDIPSAGRISHNRSAPPLASASPSPSFPSMHQPGSEKELEVELHPTKVKTTAQTLYIKGESSASPPPGEEALAGSAPSKLGALLPGQERSYGLNTLPQSDESSLNAPKLASIPASESATLARRKPADLKEASGGAPMLARASFSQYFQNQASHSPATPLNIPMSLDRGAQDRREVVRERPVPAMQVLNTFNFRQDGNVVRIEDADGSVYSGEVDLGPKNTSEYGPMNTHVANSIPSSSRAPAPSLSSERFFPSNIGASNEIAFEALGTNLSLKQKVVVQGRIVTDSPVASNEKMIQRGVESVQKRAADPLSLSATPSQNFMRIRGQALIGSNSIPLDAIPARP